MDSDRRKEIVDIWKAIVEAQKHFNDIEMRIRALFVTMVLAIAAAQGFLMEKGLSFELGNVKILYATFIPLIGALGTFLFYFMDRYWYHRLLIGAVDHAKHIEAKFVDEIPELALTASIGKASPIALNLWITRLTAKLVVTEERFRKTGIIHSDGKIELFYKPVAYLFVILFVITALSVGVLIDNVPSGLAIWGRLVAPR